MADTSGESLIVRVLQAYYPLWEAPRDSGKEWVSCLCPFHGDSRPSATVSYINDAFNCFACGEKGGAIGIIMREEKCSYRQAITIAEGLSPGSRKEVRGKSPGKPGRRVFGEQGPSAGNGNSVQPGLRKRTAPWT